jgi:hypothetical protein
MISRNIERCTMAFKIKKKITFGARFKDMLSSKYRKGVLESGFHRRVSMYHSVHVYILIKSA